MTMRIGELARRTGVSPRSLRYYEARGLLTSARNAQDERVYDAAAVERVACIRVLLEAGVPTRSVVETVPCMDHPAASTEAAAAATIRRERDRIGTEIAELEAAHRVLSDLLDRHPS